MNYLNVQDNKAEKLKFLQAGVFYSNKPLISSSW